MDNFVPMVKLPSQNRFVLGQMTESQIWAVIAHGTAGNLQSSLDWLRNPKSEVSANYVISKAGVVYELVDPFSGCRAWCNGPIHPDFDRSIKWLTDCYIRGVNPNWHTVSIEHEATQAEMQARKSMPDIQFNASVDLTAYVMRKAGLKANHQTYVEHHQIAAGWKPDCPGVIFAPAFIEVLLMRNPDLKG